MKKINILITTTIEVTDEEFKSLNFDDDMDAPEWLKEKITLADIKKCTSCSYGVDRYLTPYDRRKKKED